MSHISRLTAISRVLGLARDQLFAALVGAGSGIHADAFVMAFRIPNLMRDLFAEGALSAALVPIYARALREEGRESAQRLASRVVTLVVVVLALLVILGYFMAQHIVAWLAPGFAGIPGKTALTIFLTRVMLPFLPLVSLAAVVMGLLNAEERYGPPALSPAMFNVVALVVGGVLWGLGLPPRQVVLGWAVGVLIGGVGQIAIQLPEARRLGWRFRPEWAPLDPRIRRMLTLMAPATLGLAAAQVNIFIGSNFASHEQGAVVWLQNAFRILYLPIGLFGVAMGTISMSRSAVHAAEGNLAALAKGLRDSLRMLGFLTIPATLGLMVLARPIVRLLFERGRFHAQDTEGTAAALLLYSFGLVAYTGVKVLAPTFYSLGSGRVPLVGSVLAVGTSVGLMFALHGVIGYQAVALGTSVGAFVNVGVLALLFERRIGGLRRQGLRRVGAQMTAAGLGMGLVCYVVARVLERVVGTQGLGAQAAAGLVPVIVGMAVYLAAARRLRIPEMAALESLVRRRLPASAPGRSGA